MIITMGIIVIQEKKRLLNSAQESKINLYAEALASSSSTYIFNLNLGPLKTLAKKARKRQERGKILIIYIFSMKVERRYLRMK